MLAPMSTGESWNEWTGGIEGSTSRELREKSMELRFRPLAERLFVEEPRAESVLYCIAQYWCDEADDAVHEEIVPCAVRDPAPWPACLEGNPFVDRLEGFGFVTDSLDEL